MHAEDLGFAYELWRRGEAVVRDERADREVGQCQSQLCLQFSGGTWDKLAHFCEPYHFPVLFLNLDTKHELSTYCMPDTLLGPWDATH